MDQNTREVMSQVYTTPGWCSCSQITYCSWLYNSREDWQLVVARAFTRDQRIGACVAVDLTALDKWIHSQLYFQAVWGAMGDRVGADAYRDDQSMGGWDSWAGAADYQTWRQKLLPWVTTTPKMSLYTDHLITRSFTKLILLYCVVNSLFW